MTSGGIAALGDTTVGAVIAGIAPGVGAHAAPSDGHGAASVNSYGGDSLHAAAPTIRPISQARIRREHIWSDHRVKRNLVSGNSAGRVATRSAQNATASSREGRGCHRRVTPGRRSAAPARAEILRGERRDA